MKYVMGSYISVFMLFFLFTDGILSFFVKEKIMSVNIIVWIVVFGISLLMCDILKRLAAITIAYKKQKKENNKS